MESSLHVAIIMDGNGRWAKKRGRLRVAGHQKGAEVAKKIIQIAPSYGIHTLSLFSFSSENWLRPASEVGFLMNLLKKYLMENISILTKEQIHLRVIGDKTRLPEDIIALIDKAEKTEISSPKLHVNLVISYGGRQDITQACQQVARDVLADKVNISDITNEKLETYLYTQNIPDPDLLIRTSGEKRLSNFLLWQLAYTELYFTDTLWPDFTEKDLHKALEEFHRRDRRYGVQFG